MKRVYCSVQSVFWVFSWNARGKRIGLIVLLFALGLLIGGYGCSVKKSEPEGKPRPASDYRQQVIWTVSKEPPVSTYCVGLRGGDSAARRFKAEVNSQILQGAFYVAGILNSGSVTGSKNMRVSICRDSAGELGDIAGNELGLVRVSIRVPAEAVYRIDSFDIPHKKRGFQVPFLITCNLKKDTYYWLVLTADWPGAAEESVILLLNDTQGGGETVVRTVKVDSRRMDDGPPRGMGDWSMPQFLAKLELSEKIPNPSPAK
jgi:hypothetical protein